MNYTYILECGDGTLYTGWTNDIENRIRAHQGGAGAKYTKGRGPIVLAYLQECDTRAEAMRRESEIKKMTRSDKLRLIEEYSKTSRKEYQNKKSV